ncbi:MAG: tRNA preQ1(34) S-adenosylmethionine ribosyltransferase-isomerase QueA [Coriobacteriales bacterium]|jgi:S-adenosylmethionine:tRNA ribosyltransferase-isomerase|nr:tRNA preQ1(34) S-adenosylmethionine ribosyltransferase-isomerase QueA [Coriobacteriales bacterium]
MLTADFDYPLPTELIAQSPAQPRESCRLLVLENGSRQPLHRSFWQLGAFLRPGDLLVFNDTRVLPARLVGHRVGSGAQVELLLLRRLDARDDRVSQCARQDGVSQCADSAYEQVWEALLRPGRRLKPKACLDFGGLSAQILSGNEHEAGGVRRVALCGQGNESVDAALHRLGRLPLPPYITNFQGDYSLYQTVYARCENSAAAPTAGLHFSQQLLNELSAAGVNFGWLNLQIGLDTFRPVRAERISEHRMHSEFYSLDTTLAAAVTRAQTSGGRVIAVGTTSVRALESAFDPASKQLLPATRARTELFITPGFHFNVIDGLITNFHSPRSSLLMLASALIGHAHLMAAYREAIRCRYRFLSFGDAMLVLRSPSAMPQSSKPQ